MDADIDASRLSRQVNEMTDDIRALLKERKLMGAYRERPAYQQNDYIGWIMRAKQETTRAKRLNQMLDELATGGVYMHMKWKS